MWSQQHWQHSETIFHQATHLNPDGTVGKFIVTVQSQSYCTLLTFNWIALCYTWLNCIVLHFNWFAICYIWLNCTSLYNVPYLIVVPNKATLYKYAMPIKKGYRDFPRAILTHGSNCRHDLGMVVLIHWTLLFPYISSGWSEIWGS